MASNLLHDRLRPFLVPGGVLPLRQVEQVDVRFGGIMALQEVQLDADAGYVTGLIGPNGAGKTTMFNVITGLQEPTRGRIIIDGQDATAQKPHARARLGIARTFQRLEVFGSLSARDNILVAAEIRRRWARDGSDRRAATEEIIQRVGIGHVADDRVDSMPTGLARLVELGRALALDFGRHVAVGSPAEIQSDPNVQAAYLGTEDSGGEAA